MDAAYVFRVRFRLDPSEVWVEPNEFETVCRIPAAPPGEDGWLFFQHKLWRGNVSDEDHLRSLAEEYLDVPVSSVSFRELETDEAYFASLQEAIADDLARFNAASVEEALKKHVGSSIRRKRTDS